MKRFVGIICILYSLIIYYVWYFDKLKNYLSPQMQIYIKIISIPLLLMGIILLVCKNIEYKFKFSDFILLLPLVMLFIANDGKLSMNLANNRLGNFGSSKVNELKIDEELSDEEIGTIDITNRDKENKEEDNNLVYIEKNIDFEIIDENYEYLANYLTFSEKALKFKGKSIKVKGFSITNGDFLPSGFFALGKYIISCCAADATFSGFYIRYDLSKIKSNTWYEIEGILNSATDPDGHSILYINVTNINEITANDEEQYAYPCYVYDNGMCSAVKKYDIDYEV